MAAITRDEWLRALADAGVSAPTEDDQSAITVDEFMALFDIDRFTATRRLDALVAAGKAERTKKRKPTPYGRRVYYKAYRLLA